MFSSEGNLCIRSIIVLRASILVIRVCAICYMSIPQLLSLRTTVSDRSWCCWSGRWGNLRLRLVAVLTPEVCLDGAKPFKGEEQPEQGGPPRFGCDSEQGYAIQRGYPVTWSCQYKRAERMAVTQMQQEKCSLPCGIPERQGGKVLWERWGGLAIITVPRTSGVRAGNANGGTKQ